MQSRPNATEEQPDAIHDAIATWSQVLDDCFNGLITLTDVTGTGNNPQQAALAYVFAWPMERSDLYPPGPYDCSAN